jgi:hypothetical protein
MEPLSIGWIGLNIQTRTGDRNLPTEGYDRDTPQECHEFNAVEIRLQALQLN